MAIRRVRPHDERTRQKIQTSQLLNRLQKNANGELELTAIQQRSIEILLRKTLPDLSAVQHSGEIATTRSADMSDDELATIASRSSNGASAPASDTKIVH